MFAVHHDFLSQHSIAPGAEHLAVMKWVYHYLNGTSDLGLQYHGRLLDDDLTGFSNSNWAGDPNSQRSISGYTFIFCGAIVSVMTILPGHGYESKLGLNLQVGPSVTSASGYSGSKPGVSWLWFKLRNQSSPVGTIYIHMKRVTCPVAVHRVVTVSPP